MLTGSEVPLLSFAAKFRACKWRQYLDAPDVPDVCPEEAGGLLSERRPLARGR